MWIEDASNLKEKRNIDKNRAQKESTTTLSWLGGLRRVEVDRGKSDDRGCGKLTRTELHILILARRIKADRGG